MFNSDLKKRHFKKDFRTTHSKTFNKGKRMFHASNQETWRKRKALGDSLIMRNGLTMKSIKPLMKE